MGVTEPWETRRARPMETLNRAQNTMPSLSDGWSLLGELPPHKIFLWDSRGTYLDCEFPNPQYGHFFGGPGLVGKNLKDVLSKRASEVTLSAIEHAKQMHEPKVLRLILKSSPVPYQSLIRLYPFQHYVLGWVNDYPVQSRTWHLPSGSPADENFPPTHLTAREQEVIQWILKSKSNVTIAKILSISERTLKFHLSNLYAKFQISSRDQLEIIAPCLVTEPHPVEEQTKNDGRS